MPFHCAGQAKNRTHEGAGKFTSFTSPSESDLALPWLEYGGVDPELRHYPHSRAIDRVLAVHEPRIAGQGRHAHLAQPIEVDIEARVGTVIPGLMPGQPGPEPRRRGKRERLDPGRAADARPQGEVRFPSASLQVLFVLVVLAHDRQRVVHFNVTEHPTAHWTAQQIVEAFPNDTAPSYFLRDRDRVYGEQFRHRVKGMRITEVLTASHCPWQNPVAERLIGSIRRECLDHVLVLSKRHCGAS
jgi:hypothetical protein